MLNSLIDLFFPKFCFGCRDSMESSVNHICLNCRHQLPRVNTHELQENPIEKIFWGRIELQKATSFIRFHQGGRIQNIMHHLKYKGVKEIGITLGEMAALEIGNTDFFQEIDLILPIPIHKQKRKKRGYNQSKYIAIGIKNISSIPVNDWAFRKSKNTQSQTRKNRIERWVNVDSSFEIVDKESLLNKHILLVDDVVTTGATIEAAANELNKLEGVKLSLLTIACTF